MNPFGWLGYWRQRRARMRTPLPPEEWRQAVGGIPCLRGLSVDEMERLREQVQLFLDRKAVVGVQGLHLTHRMRVQIAAQACLPILNLDPGYYDGWHEVVVYPDSFHVRHPVREEVDGEIGIVTEHDEIRTGEAWERGPVILAWADIRQDLEDPSPGWNLVIHEFAHKLDMLNGEANGMPPLHREMRPQAWTTALRSAYEALQDRIEHHRPTGIDPYAATSPAEFFAVASEYFFTAPWQLAEDCPDVYAQLQQFYRQDPLPRLAASAAD